MISAKRSELYFTISEDERRALATVQRIEAGRKIRVRGDHPLATIESGDQQQKQQLAKIKCTACRAGELTLTTEEIAKLHPQVPSWSIVDNKEGIKCLERTFKFKNFSEALSFTNKIGSIAEGEGHHPSIPTEWGKLTVTWWSRKIKGLHRNDFIMAAKTDDLFADFGGAKMVMKTTNKEVSDNSIHDASCPKCGGQIVHGRFEDCNFATLDLNRKS